MNESLEENQASAGVPEAQAHTGDKEMKKVVLPEYTPEQGRQAERDLTQEMHKADQADMMGYEDERYTELSNPDAYDEQGHVIVSPDAPAHQRHNADVHNARVDEERS